MASAFPRSTGQGHEALQNLATNAFCHKASTNSVAQLKGQKSQCKQDAQLSQRDRAAGCAIVLDKSGRLELGDNILRRL